MNMNFLKVVISATAIIATQVIAHHQTHPNTGYDMPAIDYLDYRYKYRSMERPNNYNRKEREIYVDITEENPCNYTDFYLAYMNSSPMNYINSLCNTLMMKDRPIKYIRKR